MARGDTLIGEQLGQYRITGVLGRGGMATVYRAHQGRLGRDVALKVLRTALDPQAALRFEREARAVARLSHPNILPVYDYGEEDGVRYIAMQFIEGGRSLATRFAEGSLPPAEAIDLLARVLDALDYAHRSGVIHRDIKPANILLPRPDWPLLGDFGIAQSLAEQTQLTSAGEIIGTPAYMAPERATGRPSDARADLYAMGVMLYELLTGRPPFAGDAPLAVLLQHVHELPEAPSALNPTITPALEYLTLRALEKDPARRFQSAAEMAAALRAATPSASMLPAPQVAVQPEAATRAAPPLPTRPPVARPRSDSFAPVPLPGPAPAPAPNPATPTRRGLPWLLLAGTLLGLGLVIVLIGIVRPWNQSPANLPLTLGAEVWSGGYNGPFAGGPSYGGRTPVVVAYGEGSGLSEISASFELPEQPQRELSLVLSGMDSEGPAKTEIVIAVNGQTIFNGPNPLPDDDYEFGTGTWDSARFPIDPRLLGAGANTVTIYNRSPGSRSGPPFIIIDVALIE